MDSLANLDVDLSPMFRKVNFNDGTTKSVAVIDDQALSRDVLTQMLSDPTTGGFSVSAFANLEDMQAETEITFDLIIFCTHYKTEELANLLLATNTVAPAPVLIMSDQPASELAHLCREIFKSGISGIISTVDSRFETVKAATSFVMSGGTLLPRDFYLDESGEAYERGSRESKSGCLTQRQRDVFDLMRKGKPNKIISYELGLSTATIKVHVRAIMTALGATNRTEAVFKGERIGSANL